jgi:hypothetical protein
MYALLSRSNKVLPPIPSFSDKVRKFLLNLGMKCWNSAFNWCSRFESNYCNCIGKSSEKICSSSSAGASDKRKHMMMKLSLPPKFGGKKLVWVPVISLMFLLWFAFLGGSASCDQRGFKNLVFLLWFTFLGGSASCDQRGFRNLMFPLWFAFLGGFASCDQRGFRNLMFPLWFAFLGGFFC